MSKEEMEDEGVAVVREVAGVVNVRVGVWLVFWNEGVLIIR